MTLFLVSGCASSPSSTKPDSSAKLASEVSNAPAAPKEAIVSKPVENSQYTALGQALRMGSGGPVPEEAAKILVQSPLDEKTLNALAMWHWRQGRHGLAGLLLARALERNEGSAPLLNNLGIIRKGMGDEIGAILAWRRALKADPRHAEVNANMGWYYARGGDWKKALPHLEKAWAGRVQDASTSTNYGLALKAEGQFSKAEAVFSSAEKRFPKDPGLLLAYAGLFIENLNKPKEGLQLVIRVKFLETQKKDILNRADELERRAERGS
jgi:Tfp pilus assembly protein PilF